MCASLSDEWQADDERPRRARIVGAAVWYAAVVATLAGILLVFACAFLVLFDWGGVGSLPIVAIELGSIGFVALVSGAGGWLVGARKRRRQRREG
jgi:hypothetical protein